MEERDDQGQVLTSNFYLSSLFSRSSSIGSLSPSSQFNQLLSFGNGFKSYYDGVEAQNHFDAGIMLVWEADDWTRTY